jgi:hypothetical protein
LHHIHPPTPFPTTSHLPPVSTPTPHPAEPVLLVLRFCRRQNIKGKKRNMVFLLVWDKVSYTKSFLVLFPCIYILQLQLIHLLLSFSLPPNSLSMWPQPV